MSASSGPEGEAQAPAAEWGWAVHLCLLPGLLKAELLFSVLLA